MSEPQRHLLQVTDILRYLPHRYPFLLVDRVISVVRQESIVARKCVTYNEPFFQGHFADYPVMPGMLILEALAQTGGLLVLMGMEESQFAGKLFLFSSVEKARFRSPVVPGDCLDLECSLCGRKFNIWKIAGKAKVDGKVVAEATLTAAMVDARAAA